MNDPILEILTTPKADLHIHLEGSVSRETLKILAKKNNIPLDKAVTFKRGKSFLPPPPQLLEKGFKGGFLDFIKLYIKISECICSEEDFLIIAEEYCKSAKAQNIVASEIYVTASSLLDLNLSTEQLKRGLILAQDISQKKYSHKISWIFDIVRGNNADQELTVNLATKFREDGVNIVAIGLAGLEAGNPASPFKSPFKLARERNFKIYAHAGETAGAESIWETLEVCNPERIGHGIKCLEDENLIKEIINKEIILEVCPWSNILLEITNEQNHPLKELINKGLKVVIAADDPGIFEKNLNDNLIYALDSGLGLEEIKKCIELSLK